MLPHPYHRPPLCLKLGCHFLAPLPVPFELGKPIITVRFRDGTVDWAAVPEAAVHEHGDLLPWERDVDTVRPIVLPVPQPGRLERLPELELGGCILAPNLGHYLRTLPLGEYVRTHGWPVHADYNRSCIQSVRFGGLMNRHQHLGATKVPFR